MFGNEVWASDFKLNEHCHTCNIYNQETGCPGARSLEPYNTEVLECHSEYKGKKNEESAQ